ALMIGGRYFGLKGAMMALGGMLTVPLLIVMGLALLYAQFAGDPHIAGALRGMGAVAAGLIAATGLKLLVAMTHNVMGLTICAVLGVACFIGIGLLRLPLVYVLAALGSIACGMAWKRLRP
ncbi:MAG: chromate transporter, partial [Haliea sp.]